MIIIISDSKFLILNFLSNEIIFQIGMIIHLYDFIVLSLILTNHHNHVTVKLNIYVKKVLVFNRTGKESCLDETIILNCCQLNMND